MVRRTCVPVYDTVMQDSRASYCNDFEARRAIWTSPFQVAGQAVQLGFGLRSKGPINALMQGHAGRNTEKLEKPQLGTIGPGGLLACKCRSNLILDSLIVPFQD